MILKILVLASIILHPCLCKALTAEQKFYKGQDCHQNLMDQTDKQKYRSNWFPCIDKFKEAYKQNPRGKLAAASLFMAGKLLKQLYQYSFKKTDQKEAIDFFQRVIKRFPRSDYKRLARQALKDMGPGKHKIKRLHLKRGSVFKNSKAAYKNRPVNINHGPRTMINGLRFWSNPNYSRVVVDANTSTTYKHKFLDKDSLSGKPQRLYIDFANSILGNFDTILPIDDDLLIDVRAAQFKTNIVRVVIDIKSYSSYKLFTLKNPFRTIIDLWGQRERVSRTSYKKPAKPKIKVFKPIIKKPVSHKPPKLKHKSGTIAKQLALGVKRIVIDPGHGGRDAGAVGGPHKKIYEKNLTLAIAKRLATKIRSRLKCEVILTRTNDRFLSLEERTAIANTKNADLFISLHTNAHKDRRAYGIETYILNLATDEDAIMVAQRENAASRKNISDLETILNSLMHNTKIDESGRLAARVQKAICQKLQKKFNKIKNKGVKQAPFYVLLGAQMPSILIETAFISNKRECRRLTQKGYQDELCNGIIDGIWQYILETRPLS